MTLNTLSVLLYEYLAFSKPLFSGEVKKKIMKLRLNSSYFQLHNLKITIWIIAQVKLKL